MKRWEELPDVPGWERDLTLPTFAVYRRVFDKAVVLVSLLHVLEWWNEDGVLVTSPDGQDSTRGSDDMSQFEWAEERFGGKDS